MAPSTPCRAARGVLALSLVVLAACSPVFNWRESAIEGAELVALLPCKPDHAQRELPLGGAAVPVRMVGCEAGGATFAVAQATAADAAQAQAWLAGWRAQACAQWDGARIEEAPGQVLHAAAAPPPMHLAARRDGEPAAQAEFLWFAHAQRNGSVAVYQATVLGRPGAPDAAQTFFEGLRLP